MIHYLNNMITLILFLDFLQRQFPKQADKMTKLGSNIYISLVHELGHIYSSIGRRTNPLITKLIESLSKRSDIIHVKNSLGDLLVSVDFDMKDELVDYFKNI